MVDIIKHNEGKDVYDDPDHPIPSLNHLDVCTIKKGGGADLAIIISKPLEANQYSLKRLQDKIENYLGYILSAKFKEQAGEPSPKNTNIVVHVHPYTCKEAFVLLERSSGWVNNNQASLVIKLLNEK